MRPFCLWFFVTVDYVFVSASDSCMLVLNTESIEFWLANTMITIILWNLSSGIKYLLIKVKHSCMHLTTLDFNLRVLWIPCCSSLRTPWHRDELVMLLTVATYSQHFTGHILYWSQIDNVNNTIKYYWVHKSLSLHVYSGVLNANIISFTGELTQELPGLSLVREITWGGNSWIPALSDRCIGGRQGPCTGGVQY